MVVEDQIRGLCCWLPCGSGGGGSDGCGLGRRFGQLDLGVWVDLLFLYRFFFGLLFLGSIVSHPL